MKKLFVLGNGISYSLSPKIFAMLFSLFGQDGRYDIVDIAQSELGNIRSICEETVGFNVTKPFKEEIVKYLSFDHSGIGSVNTVKTSTMEGFSTDGDGLMFDLNYGFGQVEGNVLIVGYGGAAKACAHALSKGGFNLFVTGRNEQKAARFAGSAGISLYNGEKINGIVSCTSQTFVPEGLDNVEFCYDIRYNTPDTLKIGNRNRNGLGMLLAQAIYSYGIFFDKQFDKSEIQSVYCKLREAL